MKLNNIPHVAVENIDGALDAFFKAHGISPVKLGPRREKSLVTWFSQCNAYDSMRGYHFKGDLSITLIWNRRAAKGEYLSSYHETSVWATIDDLRAKKLDPLTVEVIKDSSWLKLRIWRSGVQRYFLFRVNGVK